MVSIFPNLCLWRHSLRSNLRGIDPEKLYRATLRVSSSHYSLLPAFLNSQLKHPLKSVSLEDICISITNFQQCQHIEYSNSNATLYFEH